MGHGHPRAPGGLGGPQLFPGGAGRPRGPGRWSPIPGPCGGRRAGGEEERARGGWPSPAGILASFSDGPLTHGVLLVEVDGGVRAPARRSVGASVTRRRPGGCSQMSFSRLCLGGARGSASPCCSPISPRRAQTARGRRCIWTVDAPVRRTAPGVAGALRPNLRTRGGRQDRSQASVPVPCWEAGKALPRAPHAWCLRGSRSVAAAPWTLAFVLPEPKGLRPSLPPVTPESPRAAIHARVSAHVTHCSQVPASPSELLPHSRGLDSLLEGDGARSRTLRRTI